MVAPVTQSVSAFDAKNGLGRLLDRVSAGEELIITRHGEPVARLVPIDRGSADDANQALDAIREIRESVATAGKKVSRREIQAWKNRGRR
jgi:prevent-host-death family protein